LLRSDSTPTDLSRDLDNLGLALGRAGQPEKQGAAHLQALAFSDRLVSQFPDNAEYKKSRGAILNNLGGWALAEGRQPEARAWAEHAIVEQRFSLERMPGNAQARLFMRNHWLLLGRVLRRQKEHVAAEHAFKESLACAVKLVEDHPGVLQYRETLAS